MTREQEIAEIWRTSQFFRLTEAERQLVINAVKDPDTPIDVLEGLAECGLLISFGEA